MARKIKVTLSLRDDVVKRARAKLAMEGRSLSELVEEFLSMYSEIGFLDKLCESLGFKIKFYRDSEIKTGRPRGFKAEETVREIRNERSNHISGY